MEQMINKQWPFWVFTITAYTVLVISALVGEGMFFDGLIYSSISRNLAEGQGNITNWYLVYTQTFDNPFIGHPPLVIIIQSFFFECLGDHLFVEKVYCFFAYIIMAMITVRVWRLTFKENPALAELAWFPVLLWTTIPIVFWSYSNNMLENTMAIFDLTAVYLIYQSFVSPRFWYLKTIASGAMLLFAFLCKGPVGLFPLAAPILGFAVLKKGSLKTASFQVFLILLSSSLILSLFFFFNRGALHSFLNYLNEQLFRSLGESSRANVESRFYIVKRLFLELIPSIGVFILLLFYSLINKNKFIANGDYNRPSAFFLAIGLSGSGPIIISMKQSGFYLVPSLVFFALSFSIFLAPQLNHLVSKVTLKPQKFKIFAFVSVLFLVISLCYSLSKTGKLHRDIDLISDINKIGAIVPENTIVSISPDDFDEWILRAYIMRYFKISLDDKNHRTYFLINKNTNYEGLDNYVNLQLDSKIYDLYKKRN